MRTIIVFIVIAISFTSCIIELELDPPHVNVRNIDEYETKEIISEVWSRGILVYEESINHAWLEIEFHNTGGVTANNVQAEVLFFDGNREIQSISINLPDIRSGNKYIFNLDTGFESIYDYTDFDVNVYWE